MSKIVIIMGSVSDGEHTEKIKRELKKYRIKTVEHIVSAHKAPELVLKIIKKYNQSKDNVCYITVAGRSNGLSGVAAANSIHPVIACPPFKDKRDYQINIHSTLQMPSQTPVLTVIDPKNAAEAAVRILGAGNEKLREQISEEVENMKKRFKL